MAKRRKFSSEPFGPAIERLMNESGTTYRGLAAKTGLSAGYLNHLVHGNRPVPSNDVIGRLSDALEVEPEYFREYRLRAITEQLEAMPELVDRLYKRYSVLTTNKARPPAVQVVESRPGPRRDRLGARGPLAGLRSFPGRDAGLARGAYVWQLSGFRRLGRDADGRPSPTKPRADRASGARAER